MNMYMYIYIYIAIHRDKSKWAHTYVFAFCRNHGLELALGEIMPKPFLLALLLYMQVR